MRSLHITPLITSQEDLLRSYLRDIANHKLIDAEEEIRLAVKIKSGDQAAERRLVTANLRFVVSCAKKYQNKGVSLSDLICEGNIGLLRAAKNFDPTRGFKFITYAVWWIRQAMQLAIHEQRRLVRLPMNQQIGMMQIKKESERLAQQLEREPTTEELAEALEKTQWHICDYISCNSRIAYLDDELSGEEEGVSLIDFLADPRASEEMSAWLEDHDRVKQVSGILQGLKNRERQILIHSFGLFGKPAMLDEDIGELFELTGERIRQIRNATLKKLRGRLQV